MSELWNQDLTEAGAPADRLLDLIDQTPLLSLPLRSRIHPLRTQRRLNATVFVKRDDELSLSAGGSKVRKFASLLPFLARQRFDEVWLLGGANSNAVAGLAPLLRQQGQAFRLILRGAPDQYRPQGNHLIVRMTVQPNEIDWIARADWPRALDIARERAETVREAGRSVYIIEEGASVEPALPGCCTLWADLRRNEAEIGRAFDHVLIDAGTGMTAAALLWAEAWAGSSARVHVLLTAGTRKDFAAALARFGAAFARWTGETLPAPTHYALYEPARPFGRAGKGELESARRWAREEGLLADPVYTARLMDWAADLVNAAPLSGTVAVVHGGGATGLFGWQDALAEML